MRNKHPGLCYRCGEWVKEGAGHFERYGDTWRVQHAMCTKWFAGTNHAAILSFQDPHRFLSNFTPVHVQLDNLDFSSVEHAYQAAKTTNHDKRLAIRAAAYPAEAKRMGQSFMLRRDWDEVRVPVMAGLLVQKFAPGSELAAQLLATGEVPIVEGNTWGDTFWGVCVRTGQGDNTLGKLLMKIRESLRATA